MLPNLPPRAPKPDAGSHKKLIPPKRGPTSRRGPLSTSTPEMDGPGIDRIKIPKDINPESPPRRPQSRSPSFRLNPFTTNTSRK